MHLYGTVLRLLWLAFGIYWLIAASQAKRNVRRASWGVEAGAGLAVAVLIVVLLRVTSFQVGHGLLRALAPGPIGGGIGILLCVVGMAFAVWARVTLGRNWGTPMSVKEDPELVTTGPYALVRHPIYSGMLLAMVGSALAVGGVYLIPAVIIGLYFLLAARSEEGLMARQFPEAYARYRAKTKLLIPYLL